jgi:DNA adenine methylase
MIKKLTQPIKWHGGKHYLANWIIGNMPPHLHYVEPFFGGGSVLLARDSDRDWLSAGGEKLPSYNRGCSEVVNDLHGELTNFWRTLQDPADFDVFRRRVELTPLSEVEWSDAGETPDESDRVGRAVHFFIRARQSRQGLMKDFATLSRNRTRRRMNEQVSSFLTAIEGLDDIHTRLKSVVILRKDACQVIEQQDGPHTLFYCDPPYLQETRVTTTAYAHEMTESDHERLLHTLGEIEGKFLLSGYTSRLYDDYAATKGWHRSDRMIDNKASGRKQKEQKCECLWSNYVAAANPSEGCTLATTDRSP